MENNMVTRLREYSQELFRLTERMIEKEAPAKVRFIRSSGNGLACRVYIAEGDQELTEDGNVYSLRSSPDRWKETQNAYQRCKARMVRILASAK